MSVAIIDADSIIYIATNCKKKYDANNIPIVDDLGEEVYEIKTLDDCKRDTDSIVKNIMKTTKAMSYLMFITVGKSFRYDIYPEYKANRKGKKLKWYDEIKEYLITKYKAHYHFGLEADDCVVIAKKIIADSFICSPDKDILCLEGTHFDYRYFKWVTTNQQDADYKFWYDMIKGQPGDNIKGAKNKGDKYAEELFDKGNIAKVYYPQLTLEAYIDSFGEESGVEEFYKNYKCLKIKDKCEGFVIPSPIEYVDQIG